MKKPDISIVIPTYNRNDELVQTVDSVLPEAKRMGATVFIIDQTPDHDESTITYLEYGNQKHDFKWIKMAHPSLTGARNTGLRVSASEIVLFVDDDVRIPAGFIERHVSQYEDPQIGGVTGQVYVPYHHNTVNYDHPERVATRHFSMEKAGRTDTFIGCNHSVRRKAMLEVGGYDEAFVASAHTEDFDAGHRLTANGYKIMYTPDAWLFHTKAPSGGCRVGGSSAPEWTHTANFFIYAFRYAADRKLFRYYVWQALRAGPLRKQVLKHPGGWASSWRGLVRGCFYGWTHRQFKVEA